MKILLAVIVIVALLLAGCSNPIETPAPLPKTSDNPKTTNALLSAGLNANQNDNSFTIFRGFPRIYDRLSDDTFISLYGQYILSEFRLFPSGRRLMGFSPCNGDIYPISRNVELYSLIGDAFGGDGGKVYFAIPNYSQKTPLPGLTYHICCTGASPEDADGSSGNPNGEINYCPITNPDYVTSLFTSEIVLAKNAGGNVPGYIVPCDGRMLKVREHQALFALIWNNFGGDAQSTFAVPDLSMVNSSVEGASYYIVVNGIFPPGE